MAADDPEAPLPFGFPTKLLSLASLSSSGSTVRTLNCLNTCSRFSSNSSTSPFISYSKQQQQQEEENEKDGQLSNKTFKFVKLAKGNLKGSLRSPTPLHNPLLHRVNDLNTREKDRDQTHRRVQQGR